jgi:uncharacterized protein YbjT (DUF2867 family)
VNPRYVRAKHEAEDYILRVGLHPTIIRAPLAYVRRQRRHPFYVLMTVLGTVPPLAWLPFGRIAPLPVDILARGVARIALEPQPQKLIYYRRDLRRRLSSAEARQFVTGIGTELRPDKPFKPMDLIGEDTPFGWTPPE